MSYQVASLVQILSNGVAVLDIAAEDGSTVTVDRAQVIRRTCSIVCTDPGETLLNSGLLTPWGNEMAVYYGVNFDDGTQELVLVGIFEITEVDPDDTGQDLVITISGSDRMSLVQRNTLTDVYSIPPNTNIGLAIQGIVLATTVSPLAQQFNFAPTTFTTGSAPITYSAGDDLATEGYDLAASIGCEFFYDPNGVCTMIPTPDPTQAPVWWDFSEGTANFTALEVEPILSNQTAYNIVVRAGSGTGVGSFAPAIAEDTNPNSPTSVNGGYPPSVDFQTSSLYATQAQAQVAANADLLTDLGTAESFVITSIVIPDADVDRVLMASRARAGVAVGSMFVVDSFVLGLGVSGTLASTCRTVYPL